MTPAQIRLRRLELGLTVAEFAYVLNLTPRELEQIECGGCRSYMDQPFEEAFALIEERLFASYAGA
ncbi:MAG: hypothetical protein ACXW2P_06960 [Thermoanaerobaculia bacterium]